MTELRKLKGVIVTRPEYEVQEEEKQIRVKIKSSNIEFVSDSYERGAEESSKYYRIRINIVNRLISEDMPEMEAFLNARLLANKYMTGVEYIS